MEEDYYSSGLVLAQHILVIIASLFLYQYCMRSARICASHSHAACVLHLFFILVGRVLLASNLQPNTDRCSEHAAYLGAEMHVEDAAYTRPMQILRRM